MTVTKADLERANARHAAEKERLEKRIAAIQNELTIAKAAAADARVRTIQVPAEADRIEIARLRAEVDVLKRGRDAK